MEEAKGAGPLQPLHRSVIAYELLGEGQVLGSADSWEPWEATASSVWSMRLIPGVRVAHSGIHSPGYVTLLGLFTCRMGTMLHFSPSLPRLEYSDQMIQSRYNSSSRLWTVCCVPGCA